MGANIDINRFDIHHNWGDVDEIRHHNAAGAENNLMLQSGEPHPIIHLDACPEYLDAMLVRIHVAFELHAVSAWIRRQIRNTSGVWSVLAINQKFRAESRIKRLDLDSVRPYPAFDL